MYELHRDLSQNRRLYNKDLAPTAIKQRKWGTYNFAAGKAHCVPACALAGGSIALEMDWKQALFTITPGNLIVPGPMLLNAHPGADHLDDHGGKGPGSDHFPLCSEQGTYRFAGGFNIKAIISWPSWQVRSRFRPGASCGPRSDFPSPDPRTLPSRGTGRGFRRFVTSTKVW